MSTSGEELSSERALHLMLDLDLDMFLDNVFTSVSVPKGRLPSAEYQPWSVPEVRNFLEKRCGLSTEQRIRGRIVTHHDEAYVFWQELVKKGLLRPRFDVVHVDPHADLAGGLDYGWPTMLSAFIKLPFDYKLKFSDPAGMTMANYLAFACAAELINSITLVRHDHKLHDLPSMFRNKRHDAKRFFVFRCLMMEDIRSVHPGNPIENLDSTCEIVVPFEEVNWRSWRVRRPFDFMTLACSPNYTPAESDELIPIIQEYMELI